MNLRTAIIALLVVLGAATVASAESRFTGVRLVVGRHVSGLTGWPTFSDVEGALVSDPAARRIRVEADGQVRFEIGYDQITSIHSERSKFPPRAFRRSTDLLVIHYSRPGEDESAVVIKLPGDVVPAVVRTLGQDTERTVDMSATTRSFAGLPIHVTPGDSVRVKEISGRSTSGKLSRVSLSAIELEPSKRVAAAAVARIDVADRLWEGAAAGVGVGLIAGLFVQYAADIDNGGSSGTAVVASVAVGALIGAGLDALHRRVAFAVKR